MNIKEIIQKLRTTMDDARGQESHFESWLTQNEGICDAIDALKELDKREPQREWVGLTDEEIDVIADEHGTLQGAIRAIEAKLKEKNT
jgi:hypothetical protein